MRLEMKRSEFYGFFGPRIPIILPVIHVIDHDQTSDNIKILIDLKISGCFLINHNFGINSFLPIIKSIRAQYPDFWIGINFLAVTGIEAFPILSKLKKEGFPIDAYWADDARIDERRVNQDEAKVISQVRQDSVWRGLYFGGTAFKKQRLVNSGKYTTAAKIASKYMDVVTTSGVATGEAANLDKIAAFRSALPNSPLALASGITAENVSKYLMVDCFMVATGINFTNDFYNIDPKKLHLLISKCSKMRGF